MPTWQDYRRTTTQDTDTGHTGSIYAPPCQPPISHLLAGCNLTTAKP